MILLLQNIVQVRMTRDGDGDIALDSFVFLMSEQRFSVTPHCLMRHSCNCTSLQEWPVNVCLLLLSVLQKLLEVLLVQFHGTMWISVLMKIDLTL